jgi:proteasome assembly chaperone (PAC2) family protein
MKQGAVKLNTRSIHRECDMIASWPGIGNVSLIIARYLREKLKAREIGYVEPFNFFDPIGVMVKDNVVEAPQFPENKFYFHANPASQRDLILFISDEQPAAKGYELASCILDACPQLKVKRVFTCAAAIVRMHHTEKPSVWAAATDKKLVEGLKSYKVILKGQVQIAGLNGLFLGVAREKHLDGICLLGEVPSYATRIANPKAALAIIEVLSTMLNLEVDLADLRHLAKQSEETLKQVTAEAMGQFIASYTKPVWPPEAVQEDGEYTDEENDEEIDEDEEDEDKDEEEEEEDTNGGKQN